MCMRDQQKEQHQYFGCLRYFALRKWYIKLETLKFLYFHIAFSNISFCPKYEMWTISVLFWSVYLTRIKWLTRVFTRFKYKINCQRWHDNFEVQWNFPQHSVGNFRVNVFKKWNVVHLSVQIHLWTKTDTIIEFRNSRNDSKMNILPVRIIVNVVFRINDGIKFRLVEVLVCMFYPVRSSTRRCNLPGEDFVYNRPVYEAALLPWR